MTRDGCAPIKRYLQKQTMGRIWSTSHSLPTPALILEAGIEQITGIPDNCEQQTLKCCEGKDAAQSWEPWADPRPYAALHQRFFLFAPTAPRFKETSVVLKADPPFPTQSTIDAAHNPAWDLPLPDNTSPPPHHWHQIQWAGSSCRREVLLTTQS